MAARKATIRARTDPVEIRPIRVVQVGVGGFSSAWLECAQTLPFIRIAALVDTNPDALKAAVAAGAAPQSACFPDLATALDRVETDAVIVLTPPHCHPESVSEALCRGLDVLVEKPFVIGSNKAHSLASLAARMNRILMVNQDYRHIPMFRRLRAELSRHPDVGADMMHVQFFRSFVPGPGSFRHQMENIFLWDMAVHHMDLLRYVLNDEIREVYATSFRPRWSWLNGNAAISAIMRTAKNTRISYDGGLVYISDREPWEGRWWVETPEAAYRVDSGRSGYGLYRQKRLFGGDDKASVRARAPRLLSRYEPRTIARLSESLRAFAEAVHTREEPATSAADNLKTIAILDAIIESSESGMPVNVKPPVLIP